MVKHDQIATTALILIIWGLAGAVFGALFVVSEQLLILLGYLGWQPLVIGACAAGVTTAALYSAMSVALVGAGSGIVASIGYLIVANPVIELIPLISIVASTGLLAGSILNWETKPNVLAFGVMLTGFLAGLGTGMLIAILSSFYSQPIAPFVVAAGVVAMMGTLFQLNMPWITRMCRHAIFIRLGSPLVAGLIATVVSLAVWVLIGTETVTTTVTTGTISVLFSDVSSGLIGGFLGGSVTGLLLHILGICVDIHHNC
jgi:hypothetical protein